MKGNRLTSGACLLFAAALVVTGCDDAGGDTADMARDATGFGGQTDGGGGDGGGDGGVADMGGDGDGGAGGDGGDGGMGGDGGAGGDGPCGEIGETRDCSDSNGCAGSVETCDGDTWGPCTTPAETCDGEDNNCDGAIDEGYAGLGDACEAGVGACLAEGAVICNAAGDGTTCDAVAGQPADESCDGIDNDCDGEVDNGFADLGAACTAGEGACAADGAFVCSETGDGVVCAADVGEPGDEICDGIDNDCNGVVDDLPPAPCYEGPPDTMAVGSCVGGERTCVDGELGACEGQVLPAMEVCDTTDNDCNGVVDDAPGTGMPCEAGEGACRADGQTVCGPDGVACDAQPGLPAPEVCDMADNDCDGAIDNVEGLGGECAVGQGVCAANGSLICSPEGLICDAVEGAGGPEQCDGLDNDCDGNTDEEVPAQPCYEGPDGTLGVGVCTGGTRSCADGEFGACEGQVLPGDEVCDERDNNCDGAVDEGDVCLVELCEASCRVILVCEGLPPDGADFAAEFAECFAGCVEGPLLPLARCVAETEVCEDVVVCLAAESVCGDGVTEVGEGCDDGNLDDGDGCDASCQFEPLVGLRPNILICGDPERDITGIFVPADGVVVQDGCAPDDQTQALIVSRGGVDSANPAWADYVLDGGRILTEFAGAEDVYNAVFATNIAHGRVTGECRDNVNPVVRFNADDPFWRDNASLPLQPLERSGCGRDMSAWPEPITPLGGWSADTVSLAYRDLGGGRVYLVEGDWQDDEVADDTFDVPTQLLMRYMALGRTASNVAEGIVQDLPEADILADGWRRCYQDTYNVRGVSLDDIFAGCQAPQMMIACRPVGAPDLTLAAAGLTAEVTRNIGNGRRAVNNHNGVDFYFSRGASWGFAPEGAGVSRFSCDGTNDQGELRMCWATSGGDLQNGGRCANEFLFNEDTWERLVFVRDGGTYIPACGDGWVDDDEECDDGNLEPGDGCDSACFVEVCGNGRLDLGEACDDGNLELGDRCDDACRLEVPDDAFASCRAVRDAGNAASGIYSIVDTVLGGAQSVYCDMETDGGGWTLVGSTLDEALNDQSADYYVDLTTLAPAAANAGIWNGLRALQDDGNNWDVRFTCRAEVGAADAAMTVDLSFYETPWYHEFVTGTDADSCFNENGNPARMEVIPARRNNLTGDTRDEGDQWDAGALEGEDVCGDETDFTIDFDDRGIDSDENDGTDWGEDDWSLKCGQAGLAGGQWFVFVRESRPEGGGL